jgi:hypothetical protein
VKADTPRGLPEIIRPHSGKFHKDRFVRLAVAHEIVHRIVKKLGRNSKLREHIQISRIENPRRGAASEAVVVGSFVVKLVQFVNHFEILQRLAQGIERAGPHEARGS